MWWCGILTSTSCIIKYHSSYIVETWIIVARCTCYLNLCGDIGSVSNIVLHIAAMDPSISGVKGFLP